MKAKKKVSSSKKTKDSSAPETISLKSPDSQSSSGPQRMVRCPTCKQDTVYSLENQFRPFCSHRCRLIDLGEWISENYKVNQEN